MSRNRRTRGHGKSSQDSRREKLYGELVYPDETQKDVKKEKKFDNWYLWLCDYTKRHSKKKADNISKPKEDDWDIEIGDASNRRRKKKKEKKKPELPKEYQDAIDFLGWDVDPEIVMAVPKTAMTFAIIAGMFLFFAGTMIVISLEIESPLVLLAVMFLPIFLILIVMTIVQKYPLNAADTEKRRALAYVPEIINYLVMEMRLKPNLERSVDFAAQHGQGKVAEDLKKILWLNQIGVYENIEEGLDSMAYKWEPYSEELKHAITMIRASVLVPNDTERNLLLDKIVDDVLESTKEKMEIYTRSMKQPSMNLFYIAVLLPLMIIIILPVAAAFMGGGGFLASASFLSFLYLFLLPLITLLYAKTVLVKRPVGYTPPKIPDNHPDLPKKGTFTINGMNIPTVLTAIIVFIVIFGLGSYVENTLNIVSESERLTAEATGKTIEPQRYFQYFTPLLLAIPTAIYLFGKSVDKTRIQKKIVEMEGDFKDALYLLASRLGEKKPLEDGIKYLTNFMPESPVTTQIFEKILRNIMVLGLTLKTAIFDPNYGALKNIPSRLMESSFKILTDSIQLGPEVASLSLISVSNQIRNIQKINDMMKKQLGDITTMMNSMAKFVAPVVLGIVASLQSLISGILGDVNLNNADTYSVSGAGDTANQALGTASSSMGSGMHATSGMASAFEFQIIVGLYVIQLVIMLAYFSGKIKHGDNKEAIMLTIAKTLPVAALVFVGSLFIGGSIMGGMGS